MQKWNAFRDGDLTPQKVFFVLGSRRVSWTLAKTRKNPMLGSITLGRCGCSARFKWHYAPLNAMGPK